jgi:RNA polymerase sigma-70 factor, ECF subfamily
MPKGEYWHKHPGWVRIGWSAAANRWQREFPCGPIDGLATMSDSPTSLDLGIRKAREDRSALARLLEQYRPFLRMVAAQALDGAMKARCDASDIVQETMIEAMRDFGGFAGHTEPEFSAWIKNIHRHNVMEVLRRHLGAERRSVRRERRLFNAEGSVSFYWNEPAARQTSASQRIIRGEKALRLAAILESLPDAQRKAVALRHLEGMSLEEIADCLDRSVAATAGLIKRGLQKLRENMLEESWQ